MEFEFQKQQQAFADRIRHRDNADYPYGVIKERIEVYEGCFFKGVNEILINCFPVLHSICSDSQWQQLARGFFANHPSRSPFFYEIPQEFLTYLIENKIQVEGLAFLIELAHYEWMELALEIAQGDIPKLFGFDRDDLKNIVLSVSDLAEIVAYHFPVHKISPEYLPDTAGQCITYLCIYRNALDEVKFIELNKVSAKFLILIKQHPQTAVNALTELANELEHEANDFILSNYSIVEDFLTKGILYLQKG